MTADLSILTLITEASIVVQVVMAILVLASIISWSFIFSKFWELKQTKKDSETFEQRFWSGIDLADLYQSLSSSRRDNIGLENIFVAGYAEFTRMHNQTGIPPEAILSGTERAMRVAYTREMDQLDDRLPFLATVGSTSPYIGLFGTVWGIMNSFRSLGNVQQATLSLVAPGISEALVATAIGLFAAIPAVMAYNSFSTRIERLSNQYDAFAEEFITLLQRQVHQK